MDRRQKLNMHINELIYFILRKKYTKRRFLDFLEEKEKQDAYARAHTDKIFLRGANYVATRFAHSAPVSAREYAFSKKINARHFIPFNDRIVSGDARREKDIRWTGKIIGADSRGLFHRARASRECGTADCARTMRGCVPIKLRMCARTFPAVRSPRGTRFSRANERRISAPWRDGGYTDY